MNSTANGLAGHEFRWHECDPAEVEHRLATSCDQGLSDQEALARLQLCGHNRLEPAAMRPAWRVLASQFRSALILVLLGAAGLAAIIGDLKDAGVILIVVVLNAVVGFFQEYRAEQSLSALKRCCPSTRTFGGAAGNCHSPPMSLCLATSCCWRQETASRRTGGSSLP